MKRRSSGRLGGVLVVAGMTACIPEPVLRVRDGGSDVVVAIADAGADVDVPVPRARPRLLAPMSGAISGSRRPALRWVPGEASAPQRVRVCADRACTRMLHEQAAAPGAASLRMDVELPAGPAFWRVESIVGGESTTSATWEFVVQGRARESVFWYGLPDFDGDGAADLVVGLPGNENERGRVFGYPLGRIASGTPSWTFVGEEPMGWFGFSLASVGDVNGDGFVDLGASALNETARRGATRVYYGSLSGLSNSAVSVLRGMEPEIAFGLPVVGLGDVNGDGYGDLGVGATLAASQRGSFRVYFGGIQGPDMTRFITVQVSELMGAEFGRDAAALGDVDRDGFDDFVIGAPQADEGRGAVWIFRGAREPMWPVGAQRLASPVHGGFGASIATLGDLDGDGSLEFGTTSVDAMAREPRIFIYEGNPSVRMTPRLTISPSGEFAGADPVGITGGHDLNGDEFPDIVVGGSNRTGLIGRAAIYLGGASIASRPDAIVASDDGSRRSFGSSLSLIGDTDRDGLSELVVGAISDGPLPLAIFVYRGSNSAILASPPRRLLNPEMSDRFVGLSLAR